MDENKQLCYLYMYIYSLPCELLKGIQVFYSVILQCQNNYDNLEKAEQMRSWMN